MWSRSEGCHHRPGEARNCPQTPQDEGVWEEPQQMETGGKSETGEEGAGKLHTQAWLQRGAHCACGRGLLCGSWRPTPPPSPHEEERQTVLGVMGPLQGRQPHQFSHG